MWAYLEKLKLHITRSLGIIFTTLPYIPGEEGEGDLHQVNMYIVLRFPEQSTNLN